MFTSSGRAMAVLMLVSYSAGVLLGWTELVVLAAASGLALLASVPFVVGRHGLDVGRSLHPHRVTVDDHAEAVLSVRLDPVTIARAGLVIDDRVDGRRVRLSPASEMRHTLPTNRRGVFTIGPASVAKADPLGLLRREVPQTGTDRLWVRPPVVLVNPVPVGLAKDLEGPTSESSPAGDVSFHALRSYEVGDDHRHIHWMSTAKTGSLMVRQYVDNRLPWVTILLDDRHDPDDEAQRRFETGVAIAASIAASHAVRGVPVTLLVGGDPTATSASSPGSTAAEDLLDRLCLVSARPVIAAEAPLEGWVRSGLRAAPETSALVIVTSAASRAEVLAARAAAEHQAHLIVVDVTDTLTLAGFALSWNRQVQA